MKNIKLYKCKICGNLVYSVEDSGVVPVCCGSEMSLLTANTEEDKFEKHIPVITRKDDKVTVAVGEVEHPMTDTHYIKWIMLNTCKKMYVKELKPNDKPVAEFCICKDECIDSAYAYCNLHGLWVKEG